MIKEYITEGKIVPMEVTVKVRNNFLSRSKLTRLSFSRMLCVMPLLLHLLSLPVLLLLQAGRTARVAS
jgi:hypothetical protein